MCKRGKKGAQLREEKLPSIFGAGDLGSSSACLRVHNALEQTAGLPLLLSPRGEQVSCVGGCPTLSEPPDLARAYQ